nr:transposase [Anaerolineae bacterium]
MHFEQEQYLGAVPHKLSPSRRGHAYGFKTRTVNRQVERIQFEVLQVRHGAFYPEALEKELCSERALTLSLAVMVVQGVSIILGGTKTEKLCGIAVSRMQKSRAAEKADEILYAW